MQSIDKSFSIILASTVHDMKNSLGMMLESLESILKSLPPEMQTNSNKQYAVVQYEYSRVNNLLMQLLAIYKIENNQLPFNPCYCNLYDFIEEQVICYIPLFEAKGFNYKIEVDDELEAVFDEVLMSMVVSNILGNAIRYAHSEIIIKAEKNTNLCICISDDGPGYPAQMLEMKDNYVHGINPNSGSTGLGLFFAQRVAKLHSHAGQEGKINITNGGALGGGNFEISIP